MEPHREEPDAESLSKRPVARQIELFRGAPALGPGWAQTFRLRQRPLPTEKLLELLRRLEDAAASAEEFATAPLTIENCRWLAELLHNMKANARALAREMASERSAPYLQEAADVFCLAVERAALSDLRLGLASAMGQAVALLRQPDFGPRELGMLEAKLRIR